MIAETNNDWTISSSAMARIWLNRLAPFLGLLLVIIVFAILIGAPEKYLSLKICARSWRKRSLSRSGRSA
jgi:hypothetical protein